MVFHGSKTNLFPVHLAFLISGDINEDHIHRCLIPEREKQNLLGTKLVVQVKYKGKLGVAKRIVSVCRDLNLLENKATVNLSVADTYRFTRK